MLNILKKKLNTFNDKSLNTNYKVEKLNVEIQEKLNVEIQDKVNYYEHNNIIYYSSSIKE